MINKTDYEEARAIAGKSLGELFDWMSTLKSDYITLIDEDGIDIIYTDGDGGLMLFSSCSEIFDHEGMRVSVIGKYCDISYAEMQTILLEMES
jgi:NAD kinase